MVVDECDKVVDDFEVNLIFDDVNLEYEVGIGTNEVKNNNYERVVRRARFREINGDSSYGNTIYNSDYDFNGDEVDVNYKKLIDVVVHVDERGDLHICYENSSNLMQLLLMNMGIMDTLKVMKI
ncbi:hypothetical protein ACH5RR_032159 [Cinchona calisaya]|uniref:Uncharacterized protein n=1 Tax=Cinchona calisaya TaxID=153742 RepID=A0ABD2YLP3_9GENT